MGEGAPERRPGRHPLRARGPGRGPRRRASWRRSSEYGVQTEAVEPVFSGTWEQESLFFECGREVLTDLHRTLVDEPLSLMLTDADGLVLNRLSGDTSLLRSLDAVFLAPGFAFSEREAGTSGPRSGPGRPDAAVVRAQEHYSTSLAGYTCAAVPVLDPVSGRLEGSVNITTWSEQPGKLLLALAQSAAGATSALMLARSRGRSPRPAPRGEVFHVQPGTLEPGSGTVQTLSAVWREAVQRAEDAVRAGHVVVAVGERGTGRATLLAQALRRARPRDRILSASPPAPQDLDAWLALWAPELGKADTSVVVGEVDSLPARAAEELRGLVVAARAARPGLPVVLTAEDLAEVPAPLAGLVDAVVPVPPLRDRPGDVLPLAHHVVRQTRGRDLDITPAAAAGAGDVPVAGQRGPAAPRRATGCAAGGHDRHAAPGVGGVQRVRPPPLAHRVGGTGRDRPCPHDTRDDREAGGAELGMSRATVYRKVAQYDLRIPR